MKQEIDENAVVDALRGSAGVSQSSNSQDVAITAYVDAVKGVFHEFASSQNATPIEPWLQITRETDQSIFDKLFLMGFRFSGTEDCKTDLVRLVPEPVAAESPPSTPDIHAVNPACARQWFVESSDEHA